MKIKMIPGIKMESGAGIRLRGLAHGLSRKCECRITNSPLFRPDAVIASKCMPQSCIPALLSSGIRVMDYDEIEWHYHKFPVSVAFRLSDFLFPKMFGLFTTTNIGLAEFICKRHHLQKKKVLIVPNGIDREMFDSQKASKIFGLSMLYAAHMGPAAKGVFHIIDLYSRLVSEFKDLKLVITAEKNSALGWRLLKYFNGKGLNPANLVLVGYVPHQEMPSLIKSCTFMVNYMHPDGAAMFRQPIKLKESLACGIPFVTNNVGDIKEFEDHIFIYESGGEFDSAAQAAMVDKSRTRNGRKLVYEKYTWDDISKNLYDNLEAIII